MAHDRSISVAALCRELQTPRHLYTEIARKIVRDGERDAEYYVQAKESPPPLTPDASLRLKVCHAHYTRITDAIQAREDEQADRELSRLRSKKA